MEETINDLWEAGIQDDHLALIFEINKKVNVAVKTPFGLTGRKNIERVIMQGEVYGPLCCSVLLERNVCRKTNFFICIKTLWGFLLSPWWMTWC